MIISDSLQHQASQLQGESVTKLTQLGCHHSAAVGRGWLVAVWRCGCLCYPGCPRCPHCRCCVRCLSRGPRAGAGVLLAAAAAARRAALAQRRPT